MECSEKRISGNYTEEDLDKLLIEQPDKEIYQKVLENWDQIAKPLDGMGRFETLIAQIGAILGTEEIDISKKAVMWRKVSASPARRLRQLLQSRWQRALPQWGKWQQLLGRIRFRLILE